MRVNRPLLCLLIVFLFFNNSFSQSSIYQDAKEIAASLENDWTVNIELLKTDSSKAYLNVKQSEIELRPNGNGNYAVSDYGSFQIDATNYSEFDTIIIYTGETVILKISSDYYISFLNYPNDRSTSFSQKIESISDFMIDEKSKFEIDSLTGDTNFIFTQTFIGPSLAITSPIKNEKELDIASNILFNLSAHVDYKVADKSTKLNFQKIQSQYSTNPFLNNLNIENPLLSPKVDTYFPKGFLDEFNSNFSTQYYQDYPWHKLLYGDSILNFQKTVSFKDASSSYRKRIVTSQNELTEASIRINETNKRKNLLDAKTVAVGLSDFIAERAQEELNLTFFNRFKQNLEHPSELTVLFPNTKNLLYQFEISNYKTLLSHARESFKVDLDNLGLNFPEVLKLEKYKDLYNSPEVFNLSLIYSIADLAYKEEPVENILISAFQKLNERKLELNKSINIELADNFLAAVTPKGVNKFAITSKQVQNNTELQKLKKLVEEYLDAIEKSQNELTNNRDKLDDLFIPTKRKVKTLKEHSEVEEFSKMNENLYQNFLPLINDFARPIQYNNRRINEYSLLNFYQKTINANLDGKEYYGYLLENPYPEDYQLFFKTLPDSINSILAEGIEGSRNLLDENFDEILNQNFHLLENASATYRKVIKEHILYLEKLAGPKQKIINFNKEYNFLKSAIDHEIVFWENITKQNKTDHHIAGLYFLKALMEKDNQVRLFINVASELEEGRNYEKLVNDFYPKTLGEDYQKNMNQALNQLDALQYDFHDKINTLFREFGKLTVNDSIYHHQQLNTQLHLDTLNFNKKLENEVTAFDTRIKMLDHAASFSKLSTSISYERVAPEIAEIANDIKSKKIKFIKLGDELDQLNKQIRNITDATEKGNINNQIDKLNEERDALEEGIDAILEKNMEKIQEIKSKTLSKFTPQKEALITKTQEKINSFKGAVTSKSLRDVYSINDNPFFEEFKNHKKIINQINLHDRLEMEDINKLDEQLLTTKQTLETLKEKRLALENYFTRLDTFYCKNLVEAHDNANNLAKSLEFSTHLLFAFRDYERIYDTVFVYDSSFIKVTVNQLDSLTGFTNTITRDSLHIDKIPVEGTTEPLIAARWITRKEFDDLRKNDLQWNLFLGLLYQRLRSIEDAPNFSAEGVALLATKFLSITHDIETYRSDLRKKKATSPELVSFKDYYPFIRSTVDLFNTVITTPSLGDTTATISKRFRLQNIPQISNEALSLYENIYVQEYGNAVLNAMELLKIISSKKLNKKEARRSQRSINAVLTYGTFMANMINAQSSDQVKNILRSATLPPGSSRIKRETVSSFTINSYLGTAAGRDRLLNVPDNLDLAKDAFGASLSVPIGFTYSFSPNFIKNNSSISIHVPLLDLGAITAYRQNPDNPNYSIDNLPDFSWNNLFSPGLFAVYNFSNSPFSLGVGGQYGPQLREITINTSEAINVNSWRFPMAFFTIDVPFFNLHTGARKIIVD